jgi:hypothetical protein
MVAGERKAVATSMVAGERKGVATSMVAGERKAVAKSIAAGEFKAAAERMSAEIKESCRVKHVSGNHDNWRQAKLSCQA